MVLHVQNMMFCILLVVIQQCFYLISFSSGVIYSNVPPVEKLNLSYYSGHWYQMYSNLVVIKSSQKHAICSQVNYRLVSNSSLFVESSYQKFNPYGELVVTNGSIFQPQLEHPGFLKLKLFLLPYPTPYVVIKLGPLIDNRYQYSVVTDDDSASLYVYARSLKEFRRHYQDEVLRFCESVGFKSYFNKPMKTPQPQPCSNRQARKSKDILKTLRKEGGDENDLQF